MNEVVLFGIGQIAEVAHFYLTYDSPYEVKAFTVDREFIRDDRFCGLPLIPFDEVERHFPPSEAAMLIAVGYAGLNSLRREKYEQAKKRGYQLISYVSSGTS